MYLKYIPEREKRTPIYNCFLEMAHSPGPSLPLQYWHWWDTVVIGYVRYWMLQFCTAELSRRKGWGLWNFKIWNEKGLLYECRKDQKLNENFYMSCPVLFFYLWNIWTNMCFYSDNESIYPPKSLCCHLTKNVYLCL